MYLTSLTDKVYIKMIVNIKEKRMSGIDYELLEKMKSEPNYEVARQYYFMGKCREYFKALSEKLGRPLFCATITFGCQMNARDSEKLSGILKEIGFVETESENADFVI